MTPSSDVVIALNYYAPYVSGLSDAARAIAEELVQRGRRVTVVTCRHDQELPGEEVINGVRVVRSHVIGRIGKGLVSPRFVHDVLRFGREAPVVNLHLPMIESGLIAKRLGRVPIVVTYHCDIDLPSGPFNAAQRAVMDFSNRFALRRAARTIPTSEDYAAHSRLRADLTGPASHAIPPPTRLRSGGSPSFRDGGGPHIGFLGRLVEEKGVEYLVDAFRAIQDPDARLLIAGDYRNIAGGSVIEKVRRHMGDDPRIRLLGFLADEQLADFYASLDVFALPSVNAFEAFGIVQVEAMRLGIAALSSDLPGVRQPVRLTGFGAIAAPRDPADIGAKLTSLLAGRLDREQGARRASELYSLERVVDQYELVLDAASRSGADR